MSLAPATRHIRIVASPLMVAVALGFLSPGVLDEEEALPSQHHPDASTLKAATETLTQEILMETRSI